MTESFTESTKLSAEVNAAADKLKGLDSLIPPISSLPPVPNQTSNTYYSTTNFPPLEYKTDIWIVVAGVGLSFGFMCAGIAIKCAVTG